MFPDWRYQQESLMVACQLIDFSGSQHFGFRFCQGRAVSRRLNTRAMDPTQYLLSEQMEFTWKYSSYPLIFIPVKFIPQVKFCSRKVSLQNITKERYIQYIAYKVRSTHCFKFRITFWYSLTLIITCLEVLLGT